MRTLLISKFFFSIFLVILTYSWHILPPRGGFVNDDIHFFPGFPARKKGIRSLIWIPFLSIISVVLYGFVLYGFVLYGFVLYGFVLLYRFLIFSADIFLSVHLRWHVLLQRLPRLL